MQSRTLSLRAPLLSLREAAYFRRTSEKGAYRDYMSGALPRTLLADGSEFVMFQIVVPAVRLRGLLDHTGRSAFDAWQRREFELPARTTDIALPPPFPAAAIAQAEQSDEQ